MINQIADIFKKQALEHLSIQSFLYNRTYELGGGRDKYPLFWLEDPIRGHNQDNLFVNSINFSILFLPQADKSIIDLQNLAFSAGLNIIERIKKDEKSRIQIRPDWSFTTLRDYYDDKACGCRFSLNLAQVNMQDLCLIEDQFDIDKPSQIVEQSPLPHLQIFVNKLPEFNIRTKK